MDQEDPKVEVEEETEEEVEEETPEPLGFHVGEVIRNSDGLV